MTDFEFLSVLVSIVVGLALTRLLGGVGRAYQHRNEYALDGVHLAWSLTVFFVIVLNWWVFLLWRDFEPWTFATFFLVILWTTTMYMMAVALYPESGQESGARERFASNRTWLLTTFLAFLVLDIGITWIRDAAIPSLGFLIYVGHYIVLIGIAIPVANRRYDMALAWWVAISVALWSFGARHTLS